MKKIYVLALIAIVAMAACTKKTYNIIVGQKAAFVVSGIHEVEITNGSSFSITMPISVDYNDSFQQTVTLSLSGLPAGITMDTTWTKTGIPSFSTMFTFYDTTDAGATTGTYPITLTAIGSVSGKKTYTFNLKVLPEPPCTSYVVSNYSMCYGCGISSYSCNVTADATVSNKIWFSNFNNSGKSVYGTLDCSTMNITIPSQVISGIDYHGSGYLSGVHHINGYFYSGTTGCNVSMNP